MCENFSSTENTLVLEITDLLECNKGMSKIKVDKAVFDDYKENTCIIIQFADDDHPNLNYYYVMIEEDNEGIYMECMEE